jgi:hypothetical protein
MNPTEQYKFDFAHDLIESIQSMHVSFRLSNISDRLQFAQNDAFISVSFKSPKS